MRRALRATPGLHLILPPGEHKLQNRLPPLTYQASDAIRRQVEPLRAIFRPESAFRNVAGRLLRAVCGSRFVSRGVCGIRVMLYATSNGAGDRS
jgi:hypothetical protein